MINIMLVDDDELLLEGLEKTIDWESIGCNIVAKCLDCDEAIEKFKIYNPQIIITDICVPGKDGFSLIASIQELSDEVKFIVLTGYPNFDYAKTAIEKNVTAFLLKPTNPDEVVAAVKKAKESLKLKKNAVAVWQNNVLVDFFEGRVKTEELEETGLKLESYRKSKYIVAVLHIDRFKEAESKEELTNMLSDAIDFYVSVNKNYILQCWMDKRSSVLLIFLKESYGSTAFLNLLGDIQLRFLQQTGKTVTVGVSGIYNNIDMVDRAYIAAKKAATQRAMLGNGRIIEYTRLDSNMQLPPQLSAEEMYDIILCIKKLQKNKALGMIDGFFDKIKESKCASPDEIKSNIEELSILILHNCIKNQTEMKNVFGRTVKPVVEIEAIELISEIKEWLAELIVGIIENPQVMIVGIEKPMVQKAVIYIMEHYSEPLTVDLVAESLFVSARHLSRQFKIETGKTFIEYLTEYRIRIAKNLLKHSTAKIYEIGAEVGYGSLKYFGKVFKEHTGISPLLYRDNMEE